MKAYWSDRQGNLPPPNACFHMRPFFQGIASPFTAGHYPIIDLPPPSSIQVLKRRFLPEKKEWIESVKQALAYRIDKIVLARCEILELSKQPDPFALTACLKQKSQGAYVFCFQEGDLAFFGASPERLFYREGDFLQSEAMAGTRPRHLDPIQDQALSQQLLASNKDKRELSPVQTFLEKALLPLCKTPPQFSPITVHKTQNVQHLYAQCKAQLLPSISDTTILNHLHPTPALCGTPTHRAMDLIQRIEPFPRGLYGGVVGWSAPDRSEWVVGIRSCFLTGKTAYLYTGTGIVEGSDPEEEWEELNQKARLYEGIFI